MRTLALPPHFQCTSGRTIKGGLVSAHSSVLLLRLPAWITGSHLWCWLTAVLWEPDQEHCDLQNLTLQMGDCGFSLGLLELNWLKLKLSFGAGLPVLGQALRDRSCPSAGWCYWMCCVNVLEWETIEQILHLCLLAGYSSVIYSPLIYLPNSLQFLVY